MKLSTRLGGASVLILLGAILALSLGLAYQRQAAAMNRIEAEVRQVDDSVVRLQARTLELITLPTTSSVDNWRRSHAHLQRELEDLRPLFAVQSPTYDTVVRLSDGTAGLLDRFAREVEASESSDPGRRVETALSSTIAPILAERSEAITTLVRRLHSHWTESARQRSATTLGRLTATFTAIILAVLVTFFLTGRSIVGPLSTLRKSAAILGDGQLDHPVELDRRDEIGDLSRTLQSMADRLRETLVSRNELSDEVTVRKRVELERSKLITSIERKNRDLEQVLYVTSHDLRSPLVNVQGFAGELTLSLEKLDDLLSAEEPEGRGEVGEAVRRLLREEIPESLHFITGSIRRMDRMLQGLLRLSRADRAEPRTRRVDMDRLLAEVAEGVRYRVREAETELEVGPAPPCLGDPELLNQVFANLTDNAVKYLDPARKGHIELGGRQVDGQCIYTVRDNGVGIPAESQDRIFEIFHRLDPRATEGEGLGLTIVRKILEIQDGSISVESTPGEGSTFQIRLPSLEEVSS